MKRHRGIGAAMAVLVLLVGAGCLPQGGTGYRSEVYEQADNWLCHGDAEDFCDTGHDATEVRADGTLTVQPWRAARRPAVDCFYLYPTTSRDAGQYSDMAWSMDQEGGSTWAQVGRFGSLCRVFAPAYRSLTLGAVASRIVPGQPLDPSMLDIEPLLDDPYADVLDAWRHYMANENDGRGVILLGHSQGSILLERLVREEIEPSRSQRSRLVAAYLIGNTVQVPEGEAVGGDLQRTPLCRRAWQSGCVVTFGSYRATVPPEPFGAIGRDAGGGLEAGCTNPAALAGGRRYLRPYLASVLAGASDPLTVMPSGPWVDPAYGTVTTPWVTLPDMVEGECVSHNGHHYLAITTHGDPADPRVDDLGGDIALPFVPPGIGGLHNFDYGYSLGDMLRLARIQATAYVIGL